MTTREKILNAVNSLKSFKRGSETHKTIVQEFNKARKKKYTTDTAYCAMTLWYILKLAGLDNKWVTESCTQSYNNAKKNKNFKILDIRKAQAGDVVFFDWDKSGDCDHVGILLQRNGSYCTVYEGNAGALNGGGGAVVRQINTKIKCAVSFLPTGDVNGDGTVNAKDALQALRHAVGKTELNAEAQHQADVNGDGKINAKDALEILNMKG